MPFSFGDFLSRMGGDQPLTADMSGLGGLGGVAQQIAAPEHKGMFGVKGTFRDILGGLGDAFLASAGQGPMYSKVRANEKLGDAMQGSPFGSDQMLMAVAQHDPNMAMEMYKQQQLGNYRNAMMTDRTNATSSRIAKNDAQMEEIFRKRAGGFGAAGMSRDDIIEYGKGKGLDWTNLKDLSDEEFNRWSTGNSMTTKDQIGAELNNRRFGETARHNQVTEGIGQQNADSNRTKAGASASQAGSAAALVPSKKKAYEASAGNTGANEEFTRSGLDQGAGRGVKPVRRRPGQAPAAPAKSSGGPPVGYKNKNGLTFKGGDPNDRRNWQ